MSDSNDGPNVVDLNKQDDEDDGEEDGEVGVGGDPYEEHRDSYPESVNESPDQVAEQAEEEVESDELPEDGPDEVGIGGNPYEDARDSYPANVEDMDESDAMEGTVYGEARADYGFDPEEAEKAFTYNEYGLSARFDNEKGFSQLETGDMVVIDTPLNGGKTGEVTNIEETWTGTLEATVDTGASKYELTPFEDEYSEKFVACIDEGGEVTDEMLHSLGKVSVKDVDIGTQVMLDVPNVGPTRGMVQEKKTTDEQGAKVVVNTGPVAFDVFEDPSPTNKKEQPFLVGRISE
jgi:hypothetical protein